MEIKTKFSLDQTVWFMKDNHPTPVEISAIKTFNVGTNQDSVRYNATDCRLPKSWLDHEDLHENILFATKDDLCKKIFGLEKDDG